MGPKAWMILLGLGVGGVFALGLLAAYAVEQSPDLKAIVLLKTALARELGGEGLAEVSVRRLPGRGGHLIQAGLTASTPPPGFEDRVARVYTEAFPQLRFESFDLVLESAAPAWGCVEPEPLLRRRVTLRPYYEARADQEARALLEAALRTPGTWALERLDRDGRELRVRLRGRAAPGEEPEAALAALEARVRAAFRARPYGRLHLTLEPDGAASPAPPARPPSPPPGLAPGDASSPRGPQQPAAAAPARLEGRYDFGGRRID